MSTITVVTDRHSGNEGNSCFFGSKQVTNRICSHSSIKRLDAVCSQPRQKGGVKLRCMHMLMHAG